MSRDIAQELRDKVGLQVGDWPVLIHEAADEIERLSLLVEHADKTVKAVHDRLPPGRDRMALGHYLMRC